MAGIPVREVEGDVDPQRRDAWHKL